MGAVSVLSFHFGDNPVIDSGVIFLTAVWAMFDRPCVKTAKAAGTLHLSNGEGGIDRELDIVIHRNSDCFVFLGDALAVINDVGKIKSQHNFESVLILLDGLHT